MREEEATRLWGKSNEHDVKTLSNQKGRCNSGTPSYWGSTDDVFITYHWVNFVKTIRINPKRDMTGKSLGKIGFNQKN